MKKHFFLTLILLCFNIFITKAQSEKEVIKNIIKEREKNINTLKEHKDIDKVMNTFDENFTSVVSNIENFILLNKNEAFELYSDLLRNFLGQLGLNPHSKIRVELEKINFLKISKQNAYISYSFFVMFKNRESVNLAFPLLVTEVFEKKKGIWKTIHVHSSDNFDVRRWEEEMIEERIEEEED